MTEIAISPLGEREFRVRVTEGGRQTTHRVSAPERLGGGLELSDEEPSEVVRQSVEFLLEREPASSILSEFRSTTSRATSPSTSRSSRGGLAETAVGAGVGGP